jgi:hypothetical protein
MKQMDYERILVRIGRSRPMLDSRVEFSLLCMQEGVDMTAVENRIYNDFGMSADELIDIFHAPTIAITI